NGPFFSERAIAPLFLLYSSTRRRRPHCACRVFLNPRTGPGTRCDFGQNGHTNRVPNAFGVRSTITAHPGLHSLYSTGSSGTTCLRTANAGLAAAFGATRFATRLLDRFALPPTAAPRPAVRLVRVAARRVSAIASARHSQLLLPCLCLE